MTLNKLLYAVAFDGVTLNNLYCGDYTAIPKYNDFNSAPHDAIEGIKGIFLKHFPSLDTDKTELEDNDCILCCYCPRPLSMSAIPLDTFARSRASPKEMYTALLNAACVT